MLTTVFRLGGVDTEEAERFRHEDPETYAKIDRQAKRLMGGSWDLWWLKTPLPGIVWCNCPHMTGLDGLSVEDITRADFDGRKRIYALVDFVRANMPGFASSASWWMSRRSSACARRVCWRATMSSPRRT